MKTIYIVLTLIMIAIIGLVMWTVITLEHKFSVNLFIIKLLLGKLIILNIVLLVRAGKQLKKYKEDNAFLYNLVLSKGL